jgi:hypothetical protein
LTAVVVAAGVGFGALGALAAGCSDSGDEITVDPTTTESTTTTASTTTTTESTTTESTPTTLDDEATIRELHEYYLTDVWNRDERKVTLEEQIAKYEAIAVDPLRTRAIENLTAGYERGDYAINPGAESNVIEIDVQGDKAVVTDCILDSGVLYSAEGEVLIPGDEIHQLVQIEYAKVGEKWFVKNFFGGAEAMCDPDTA